MRVPAWSVATALCLSVFAVGCAEEKESPTQPPSFVTPVITPSPSTVLADGTATVTLVVTGAAPVSIATTRGVFLPGGLNTAQLATSPGSITLRPCDARTNANCAGPAVITATGADSGQSAITVTFQGFESCSNGRDDNGNTLVDCADPQCPLDSACGANGLVCSSTGACNKCTVAGGRAVEASGERSCGDGADNDCDGLADCADDECADEVCTTATSRPGVCVQGACSCAVTEAAEASCSDGKDNDCDGLIDCQDGNCLGKVCDGATGRVCPGPAPSVCGVCLSGLTTEPANLCGDGKDNDCDGASDCYDPDCQPSTGLGAACNQYGGRCIVTSGIPSCGCPSGATSETACSGGVDDDCDGKTDCADDDCQPVASGAPGAACGPFGQTCSSSGACACGSNEEICGNYDGAGQPVDDDCDGRANCLDRDCRPTAPGEPGQDCSTVDQYGMACDATGTCACTGNGGAPEATEVTCDDGLDNDCDFLVDCQDPACGTRACGPGGAACNATSRTCVCPGGATETSCTDGIDNNCNAKTDCEEPSCAAQACNGTFPAYRCIAGNCTDPATEYSVAVTPVRPRIPANGKAKTAVNVVVLHKGVAKPGVSVSFALSDPTLGTLTPVTSVVTDALGRAQVTFTSSGPVGVETITATVVGVGASGTGTVEMPAIGEIRLAEGGVLYPVMGVKTSGFQEQNQLLVEVLDTQQRTYPDGLDVVFEHRPLGGSTMSDLLSPPACAVTPCVQSRAVTMANGTAAVRLYSGTVAGVVKISATAAAGGISRLFELPSIAIVGAKPNAGHFSLVCDPENVAAYAASTCHVSTIDEPFTCVAYLKDRYNNVLGRATTVSFMSEAGAVGPPAVTPEYDPESPAAGQGDLGSAVEIINTLGAKLPKDVPAYPTGEESITGPADVCGVTQRNPRDGAVTVVAWTPGEEAFFDANGNGQYDLGEPFVDQPEPYVDYDDDDVRDADEPFIDSDGDGAFDVANGVWDTSSNIWTRTVVVYSGMPAFLRVGAQDYESRWMEPANVTSFASPTPLARFDVRPWFPPDPHHDCDLSANGVRDILTHEKLEDLDGDGVRDPNEMFEDCNGNGVWDADLEEPWVDLNGNGMFDLFSSNETSEELIVAASDRNLNRLSAKARYSVTKPDVATFTLSYDGKLEIADHIGMGFSFQPCLASSPTTCALDCADITSPPNMRCVMRTRLADFSGGYTASVTFRGSDQGEKDGDTQAFWNVTLFDETLVVSVPGSHK